MAGGTSDDPFAELAAQTAFHRAFAARGLYRSELVADFAAQTGFVQRRNGKVPEFRALDVDVDVKANTVTIRGQVAIWDLFREDWRGLGGGTAVEKRLGPEDLEEVRRFAAAAAQVPADAKPISPGAGRGLLARGRGRAGLLLLILLVVLAAVAAPLVLLLAGD